MINFKDYLDEGKRGLWDNIHAKRKRIKAGSGERMRKPGSKGAPTDADFKAANEEVVGIDELNKDTVYSYAQKANNDMSKKHKELAQQVRGNKPVEANKTSAKLSNRDKGLDRAEKRLNKEGVAESEAPLKHHNARVSYHKEGDPHRRYEAIFKTTHSGGKEETEKRAKAAFAAKKKIVYNIVHEQLENEEVVAEETIHVGHRNSKGVWIKTSTHLNYPDAAKAMKDLEAQGKKGVQHRYDNKGNIDPGMRKLSNEEVEAQFDLIEEVIEELALAEGLDSEFVWETLTLVTDEELLEYAIDKKGHKSSTGGLTQKGVDAYNAKTGGNLQTAVTTPPSKLKPGSKAANRRKSFCARMGGVEGPMKDDKGRPTRKALALRKWNC
jgi:hypothetical protein